MTKHIAIRALVIDDDESVCRRVKGWLEDALFEVDAQTDPRDGIRQAAERAAGAPFAIALVDLRMPEIDGAAVIAELARVSPRTRSLAMSAFPEREGVAEAMRAGARELLEKPLRETTLLSAVTRQLSSAGVPARTEQEFNRVVGARVRAVRVERKRSQVDVAAAAGISAAQLSQIELGKNAASSWTMARLCVALDIRLAEFFDGV